MLQFSDHLFWDTDRTKVDVEQHAPWLIKRVLEYGLWADFCLLIEQYGKNGIAEAVTQLRTLNPRSRRFCEVFFRLSPSSFRCLKPNVSRLKP